MKIWIFVSNLGCDDTLNSFVFCQFLLTESTDHSPIMDFGSSGSNSQGSINREEIMDQVKQQIALVNAQELLTVSWCYGQNDSDYKTT